MHIWSSNVTLSATVDIDFTMYLFHMVPPVRSGSKSRRTVITNMGLHLGVCQFMSCYVVEVKARIITVGALVALFLEMYSAHMLIQLALVGELLLTFRTDVAAFGGEEGGESRRDLPLALLGQPRLRPPLQAPPPLLHPPLQGARLSQQRLYLALSLQQLHPPLAVLGGEGGGGRGSRRGDWLNHPLVLGGGGGSKRGDYAINKIW